MINTIKNRIMKFAGEVADHMGKRMADAFESRGEEIMLADLERQEKEDREDNYSVGKNKAN